MDRAGSSEHRRRAEDSKMIKVSVLYPNTPGSKFDMDYYCGHHMELVKERLGSACKDVSVEAGLGGAAPGSQPTYVAMGHMLFDSIEAYQQAFGPHADEILGDIPNYTDTQPVIQVSEVKL
jgi:uncharacterized protein (TIGR02118 family)